jgi:hypothetical protein
VKERPDWFNPSRMIYRLNAPRLQSVTTSPYIGHLGAHSYFDEMFKLIFEGNGKLLYPSRLKF